MVATNQGLSTAAAPSFAGSTVAVTSGGITINLLFDAAAMAAPQSFRTGIEQAAILLASAITDKIIVNIDVDSVSNSRDAGTFQPVGMMENYFSVRENLINHATPGDTTFNALPLGLQGWSTVEVFSAQQKLWRTA